MRFKWKVAVAFLACSLVPLGVALKVELDRLDRYSRSGVFASMETQTLLKGQAVESYFGQVILLSQSLASRPETAGSLRSLARTAQNIVERKELVVDDAGLTARYAEQARMTPGADPALVQQWTGKLDEVARRLQQIFIVDNEEPLGSKEDLTSSEDGSAYSALHRAIHPVFCDLKVRFGFYDLFLIDPDGRIVYSVEKETDFGTSLIDGPYAATAFGRAAQRMTGQKAKDMPFLLADFEPYAASHGDEAAFILVPIWDGTRFGGILAFQLPIDFANRLLEGAADGKQSSDTYIVGADQRLRSVPRFDEGLTVGTVVQSDLLKRAIANGSGVLETTNHHDIPVMAAFRPLKLSGVDWRIISEISQEEALSEAFAARRNSLLSAGIAALAILLAGAVLSYWLLLPLKRLGRDMQGQAVAAVDMLRSASVQARGAAQIMSDTVEETSRQSRSVLAGAEDMSTDVTEVATSVNRLSTSIAGMLQGIVLTSELMETTAGQAELARRTLAELETVATRITGIVTLIHEVANQTNLLSLNAAIEASHAGAAGRGFSVVASEIRKLAVDTTKQTEEIAGEVRHVLHSVARNAEVIRSISQGIGQVNDKTHGISVSAGEQGTVTQDIAGRMAKAAARVAEASGSMKLVHSASAEAARAATDVLGGVALVETATEMMDVAVSGFVRRVSTL